MIVIENHLELFQHSLHDIQSNIKIQLSTTMALKKNISKQLLFEKKFSITCFDVIFLQPHFQNILQLVGDHNRIQIFLAFVTVDTLKLIFKQLTLHS